MEAKDGTVLPLTELAGSPVKRSTSRWQRVRTAVLLHAKSGGGGDRSGGVKASNNGSTCEPSKACIIA
jgi:hypothetical protein